MPAAPHDWTIEQGTTLEYPITWKDDDGVVINVTGYTARLQARETIPSATTLLELTTENGGITVDGPAGQFILHMSDTETAALNWPAVAGQPILAVYDMEIESPGGVVTRLLKGIITLDPEVTR